MITFQDPLYKILKEEIIGFYKNKIFILFDNPFAYSYSKVLFELIYDVSTVRLEAVLLHFFQMDQRDPLALLLESLQKQKKLIQRFIRMLCLILGNPNFYQYLAVNRCIFYSGHMLALV